MRASQACNGAGMYSFVGGADHNIALGYSSGVLSGGDNDACDSESGIVAGYNNVINSSGSANLEFIGGGSNNGASGATAFIGGGSENMVTGLAGSIGGGNRNTVSNGYGVIGGGNANKVSGEYAIIGGGNANSATGTESTVAGGGDNIASGYASFAAGTHADADESGSFVWSDSSSSATTKATAQNEFVARTSGGVDFYSNSTLTTGVVLAPGSGTWASVSDRAVKNNVQAIDDAGILDKVASLPISEWSYISEHGVRHVGPMAQDFYAAFGVGEDNRHITSIDEDGVALAAIKALHADNATLHAENASLRHQLRAMQGQVQHITALVEALHSR